MDPGPYEPNQKRNTNDDHRPSYFDPPRHIINHLLDVLKLIILKIDQELLINKALTPSIILIKQFVD